MLIWAGAVDAMGGVSRIHDEGSGRGVLEVKAGGWRHNKDSDSSPWSFGCNIRQFKRALGYSTAQLHGWLRTLSDYKQGTVVRSIPGPQTPQM